MNSAMNPETGTIYSRAELKAAFDLVCNKDNWKLPIKGRISTEKRDIVREAIIFYTGSVPTFTDSVLPGNLVVRAKGYYAAVGA